MNEVCENSACDWANCMQRHPIKCKYYTEFMRCKFSPCAFKHVKNDTAVNNNVCVERFLEVERKIDSLGKQLADKNDVIDGLVKKVNDLENVTEKNLNDIDELNNIILKRKIITILKKMKLKTSKRCSLKIKIKLKGWKKLFLIFSKQFGFG